MALVQCWEIKNCGRQPDGAQTASLGLCPASTETSVDGLNGGKNGGRICWAVTGTFCGGKVQGTFAQKQVSCMTCNFYKQVKEEQGTASFLLMKPGQTYAVHG